MNAMTPIQKVTSSCQYLFPTAVSAESLDCILSGVTSFSIAFAHNGVDLLSTQSVVLVTLCVKSGERELLCSHHNQQSVRVFAIRKKPTMIRKEQNFTLNIQENVLS